MKKFGISRRNILRGLGAAAVTAPFLPLLNASGQEMGFPKRLLLVYTPDGTGYTDWMPTGSSTDFNLGPIHQPLEPHKADIRILGNMRLTVGGAGEGHAYGMAGLWTASRCKEGTLFDGGNEHMTGWGSGTSIDQTIARAYGMGKPYMQPPDSATPETPYRTLELGVQTGSEHIVRRMIYAGDDAPIASDDDPYSVFDRLFGSMGADAGATQRRLMARRSVLDLVSGELSQIQSHGAALAERPKIEAHLEGIRAIEQRLSIAASTCAPPTIDGMMDINANDNFPALVRLQTDLAVRALSCDLTRVASLQFSRGFSNIRHNWIGASEAHHSLSHTPARDWNESIDTWYAEQFAYLLEQLKSVPEGDGTLLDNTLVLWGRELGIASGHARQPVPLVVAGRAGGAVQTGFYDDNGGAGHHRMLIAACNAMGLDEVTSYGNLDDGGGALDWT
jgi:hypothetical protein